MKTICGETIPGAFFKAAEKFSKKNALLYKKEGVYFPVSYGELAQKIKNLAGALQKLGVGKKDGVAILSENRPEWVMADMASLLIGAVTVPLHSTLSPKAIGNIIKHSKAKVLIVSNSNLLHKVLSEKKGLDCLKKIIFLEKLAETEQQTLKGKIFHLKSVLGHNGKEPCKEPFLDPDDVCTVIYTSGTTGNPKGVALTHNNILSNIEAIQEAVPVKETDMFLSFLPLSHILERTTGYYLPLFFGATIAYAENIKQLSQNLREVAPTVLISVPRIFEKFHDGVWDKVNASSALKKRIFKWALRQKRGTVGWFVADILAFKSVRKKIGGKLRLAVSGGASLSENLGKFFLKMGILIIEGYGLTETSPVVSVNRENDFKFGTVGKAVARTKIKISPAKEILVKGPGVFSGYFRDKKNTKAAFDKDGWFNTGDAGFIDDKGFLTVIGRKKEMFVLSGGKNVWPEPVENRLNNDKFILQSFVFGNKRKFVSALIAPDWQEVEIWLKKNNLPMEDREKLIKNPAVSAVFKERIETKINPHLSDFEQVKKFKLLLSAFSQENDELTPTLKLRRHIIEKHHQKEIESLYE